jgi:hypothetical protein
MGVYKTVNSHYSVVYLPSALALQIYVSFRSVWTSVRPTSGYDYAIRDPFETRPYTGSPVGQFSPASSRFDSSPCSAIRSIPKRHESCDKSRLVNSVVKRLFSFRHDYLALLQNAKIHVIIRRVCDSLRFLTLACWHSSKTKKKKKIVRYLVLVRCRR